MAFEKSFFCSQCGSALENKICIHCGFNPQDPNSYGDRPALGAGGIGWSQRANDPKYSRYQTSSRLYIAIFTLIVIIIIPLIMFATGDLSFNKEGIIVVSVIAVMFFVIAIFSIRKTTRRGEEWEGVIETKTEYIRKKDGEPRFVLAVRLKDDNRLITIDFPSDPIHYEYYRIGDRIKRHSKKHLRTLEKYDKRLDEILFCPSCSYLCDSRADYCEACGSPLLKGTA